jgi:cell cycle arrest protein BUB2
MDTVSTDEAQHWRVALRDADAWKLRSWLARGHMLPAEASQVPAQIEESSAPTADSDSSLTVAALGFPAGLQTARGAAWVLLATPLHRGALSQRPEYVELLDHISGNLHQYGHLLDKIEQDIPRTFQGTEEVRRRVSSESLVRVLLASAIQNNHTYLQGMNLFAAAFLYLLPESEAFALLVSLTEVYAPRYFRGSTLAGVHDGCKLAAEVLQHVDPELASRLNEDPLGLEQLLLVHGFPAILSLSLSIPPLEDALRLLDWVFAFGAHFGVLFVVARLCCSRDQLLRQTVSVKQVLNPRRSEEAIPIMPQAIVRESLALIPQLRPECWQRLQRHPVCEARSSINSHENSHGTV